MNMNIDVDGVQALKSHVPDVYADVSLMVFQPQKTPVFVIETVPDTYITIIPPVPSVPFEPAGCRPLELTPRYLTTPSIETFPSMKTLPRTSSTRVLASQSSSPTTAPLAFVVRQV